MTRCVRIGFELHDVRGLSDDNLRRLKEVIADEILRRRQLDSGDPEAQAYDRSRQHESRDGAKWRLGSKYEGSQLDNHASRLWNVLYRETKYGGLNVEGYCVKCGMVVRKQPKGGPPLEHLETCKSRSGDSGRTIVFTVESILANKSNFAKLPDYKCPAWLKRDFEVLVKSLSQH